MKINWFILISLVGLFFACNSSSTENDPEAMEKEIQALVHDSLQSNFLDQIYLLDKEARRHQSSMLQIYGFNSDEYKQSREAMEVLDKSNLAKIERYLEVHGHPSRFMHSREARITPHQIIHHSATVETREKNFDTFFAAFETGDIRGPEFALFLDKWYKMKTGSSMVIKNPFKEDFEIDTLLYSLGLKDSMDVVRQ